MGNEYQLWNIFVATPSLQPAGSVVQIYRQFIGLKCDKLINIEYLCWNSSHLVCLYNPSGESH